MKAHTLRHADTTALDRSCSWALTFPAGQVDLIAIPAISRSEVRLQYPSATRIEVAQGCNICAQNCKPGLSGGYCISPDRQDLAPAYGANHPAKRLPADRGLACEFFLKYQPSQGAIK